MKRIINVVLFLIVIFSIPYLISVSPRIVIAAASAQIVLSTPQPKAGRPLDKIPTPVPKRIEYMLPYPGMLPDNPLYFLKNLRDKIIEMLISDPVNKAEFYILQADKKLNMGITLSAMGKSEETQEVLAQALAARTQAVASLETIVQSGKQVPVFVLEKLSLSLKKHKEVLTDLKLNTDVTSALLIKAQQMLK